MNLLKKRIGIGAKVGTKEGDGIVVGVLHTNPCKLDILLLDTKRVLGLHPEPDVTLIDSDPIDDQTIPQAYRDWLKTRPSVSRRELLPTN